MTRQHEVKVTMSGDDYDEASCGYLDAIAV
jgi:hypothetical protein